ncbi:hypothetical protein CPB84DRAFT_1795607 [Gymnopilus junonius]|uniref:F-box domain-containing protein n=1 Tax=Gymnopilus junonius TaxID=109634 RepID=A0A9P5NBT0_GYMJU|nr:hypothetical protein CPB84DRAFT_1795607 [Gymnopilus junonius]
MYKSELSGRVSVSDEDVIVSKPAVHAIPSEELETALTHFNLDEPADGPQPPATSPSAILSQENIPMMNLPPELLAHIFDLACHDPTSKFYIEKNRKQTITPFILGGVCSQWRAVVWSTPTTWSRISLYLVTSKYETQLELLKGWLARTGKKPLTIDFLFQEENDWCERIPTEIIELLRTSAPRWREINWVLPEAWYPLLAGIKFNLPLLTTLSTQSLWHDCSLSPSKRKRLDLFADTPALRDLHLNGYYLSDVDIPWKQLVRLKLQHVYIDECFFALSETQLLESCKMYTILYNDVNRTIEAKSIGLPFLTYLHFYHSNWEDAKILLSSMTAPSLRTLEFTDPLGDEVPLLPSLLSNIGCNLTRLKVVDWSFTRHPDLVEFIRGIFSLTEIKIRLRQPSSVMSDFFIQLLWTRAPTFDVENEEETYFLPYLKHFTFSGCVGLRNGFENELLHLLQCRRPSTDKVESKVVPLLSFTLDVFEGGGTPLVPGDELKGQLQVLVTDGLELSIAFEGTSWL